LLLKNKNKDKIKRKNKLKNGDGERKGKIREGIFKFETINDAINIPESASPATSPDDKRTPFSFFLIKFEIIPPIPIVVDKLKGR
jgi:hypothetical protein